MEKNFNFRSYSFPPYGIVELQFYDDDGGTLTLMPKDEFPMNMVIWLSMMSPTLLPFKSEITEGVVNYNPQGVMRKLAMTN